MALRTAKPELAAARRGCRAVERTSSPSTADAAFADGVKMRSRRRTRGPSYGRTALLCGLAAFVAMELLLSAAMDYYEPALRDPLWGRKIALLRTRLAEEPDRPLVVVLGSSRAALGLRLGDSPSPGADADSPIVFNLGIMGAGPVHELVFLQRLLAEGIRPQRLLLEIHPLLMHEDPGFGEVAVLNVNRLDWKDLSVLSRYVYEPEKMYARWGRSRMLPCLSHRVLLQMHVAPAWLEPAYRNDYVVMTKLDRSGWTPHFREAVNSLEYRQCLELSVKSYEPAFNQYRITDMPDRAVREILAICRREQIAAGLFLMPESSEFRTAYAADARGKIDDYLARLSMECGVPVFDATLACRDEDFADGHHLLPPGAKAFAANFRNDVLRPFLNDGAQPLQTARRGERPAAELAERPAPRNRGAIKQ